MPVKQQTVQLKHQELALDAYLDSLLEGVGLEAPQQPQKKTEKDQLQKLAKKQLTTAEPVKEDKKQFKQLKRPAKNFNVVEPVKSLLVMPEWTQNEFQALFFRVDQLILAAPLTELLRTVKLLNTEITKMPGQASWFMGLIEDQQQQIGVLDTGHLVLGKTREHPRDLSINPFNSLLITDAGNWGLACDEVLSIGKLTTDKVRWRSQRNSRPWLIGTIVDELTAIVDIKQLLPKRKI